MHRTFSGSKTSTSQSWLRKAKGWKYTDWANEFKVDKEVKKADPNQHDALLLPGGHLNSDTLRMDEGAIYFIRLFCEFGKTNCCDLPRPVDSD